MGESYEKNRFGKNIYKLCQKKSKESKETYYIYIIGADECSNYGDVTVGSKDCFAMVEGVGGDQSIVGRACQMPEKPSSCYYEHSSSDGDCQVKVYHSKLDSDDYYEKNAKMDISFIIYREAEKKDETHWSPNWSCDAFPPFPHLFFKTYLVIIST